ICRRVSPANIVASGVRSAIQRRSKCAPAKSAIAPIGAKFHGWGITRSATPPITIAKASQKRGVKMERIDASLTRNAVADADDRPPSWRWVAEDLLVFRVGEVFDLQVGDGIRARHNPA